jgi:hypothetical protein
MLRCLVLSGTFQERAVLSISIRIVGVLVHGFLFHTIPSMFLHVKNTSQHIRIDSCTLGIRERSSKSMENVQRLSRNIHVDLSMRYLTFGSTNRT